MTSTDPMEYNAGDMVLLETTSSDGIILESIIVRLCTKEKCTESNVKTANNDYDFVFDTDGFSTSGADYGLRSSKFCNKKGSIDLNTNPYVLSRISPDCS